MLVEAKDRRKQIGGYKNYWRKGVKRQTNTEWEMNELLRMEKKETKNWKWVQKEDKCEPIPRYVGKK